MEVFLRMVDNYFPVKFLRSTNNIIFSAVPTAVLDAGQPINLSSLLVLRLPVSPVRYSLAHTSGTTNTILP